MILVIGTVTVPPEAAEAVRPAMADMMRATREEAGCVSYNLCEDLLEPGRIVISEEWESMAALEAHFAADHMATWRQALADVSVSARDVKVYDGTLARAI